MLWILLFHNKAVSAISINRYCRYNNEVVQLRKEEKMCYQN